MSAPLAGGSPMPGQWPEPNSQSQQPSYDSNMAHAAEQRSHNSTPQQHLHSHSSPPSRQPTDPSQAMYANQSRELAAPRAFQSSASAVLDGKGGSNKLSAETKPDAAVRRPSASRVCAKCGNSLSGQFVRALDATYHLECFTCHVSDPPIHRPIACYVLTVV
jgi:hypothetical protein